MPIESSTLRLSAQQALLGHVTPNLRAVLITSINNTIHLYFFYEGVILDEVRELAEITASEVISDFPNVDIECHIERLDYPNKIRGREGSLVYKRCEDKL